jgi:hypothetical protein
MVPMSKVTQGAVPTHIAATTVDLRAVEAPSVMSTAQTVQQTKPILAMAGATTIATA